MLYSKSQKIPLTVEDKQYLFEVSPEEVPALLSHLYRMKIPFIQTVQPSRIMVLIDFCLAILAALGLDYLMKEKKALNINQILSVTAIFILIFIILWGLILFPNIFNFSLEIITGLQISKRNLIFPTGLLFIFSFLILSIKYIDSKKLINIVISLVVIISTLDLLRFGQKFTPFSSKNLLYPETQTTNFLKNNLEFWRFMTMDRSIMPPNISIMYKLPSVDGYDPIYLKNYAQIVASWSRNLPDFKPASFNRILTPQNIDNLWTDLLGVKYILSFNDENNPKLKQVYTQGRTKIYQNLNVYPRAFLVEEIINVTTEQEILSRMYADSKLLLKVAYSTKDLKVKTMRLENTENAKIKSYSENKISINVSTKYDRLLILTDVYFPEWKVFINNKESEIFPVDFNLQGVIVPSGESLVEFKI